MSNEILISIVIVVFSFIGAGIIWTLFNNEFASMVTFYCSLVFSILALYLIEVVKWKR